MTQSMAFPFHSENNACIVHISRNHFYNSRLSKQKNLIKGFLTMIKHIQPNVVPRSGAPFSQVVTDGLYAHLAGLVAADFPEGLAVLGDVTAETRAVMTAVQDILNELGLGMERLVRIDVHLADLSDFDKMDLAYREFFIRDKYPARTTTQSPRLFGGSKVEITCMALL
jgi:2-iminobutanoate/2-iminopropanoate deaminase